MELHSSHDGLSVEWKPTTRRSFLKSLSVGTVLALSGCSTFTLIREPSKCSAPNPEKPLTIDMHCHIMNLRDVPRGSFIARRFVNSDEEFAKIFLGVSAALGVEVTSIPNYFFTRDNREESRQLMEVRKQMQENAQAFCKYAEEKQGGVFYAKSGNQSTGLISNRVRNAARLMHLYPDVDLFTPSIVDLYEGDRLDYSSPEDQALLYSEIAAATNGRFLPLISFNPRRHHELKDWSEKEDLKSSLELVEYAIKELGFIGVKVHPSSGFAPIDNALYGCSNNPIELDKQRLPDKLAKSFDEYMMHLYKICRRYDVPILTHHGIGIPSNEGCMMQGEPEEWTNAPTQWRKAIDCANAETHDRHGHPIPSGNKLRVCLAHFSGGFQEKEEYSPHPWLKSTAELMKSGPGLYIDLSEMSEMFRDEEGSLIHREYREAFTEFVDQNPLLAQRMMYGSDWHLPRVARRGTAYLKGIKSLIPDEHRESTMGWNAVEFFGLEKGRANRERVDRFLKSRGVDFAKIGWRNKVDAVA